MSVEQALRILVVDDEPAIRNSFRNLLEDYNYQVIEASNGAECLKIFPVEKPDLVLLDIKMPEMDGLEVLQNITKASPDTPVIIVSGAGIISDVVDALHFGAWDYHLKPIKDLGVLIHSIKKSLDRSRLYKENRRYRKHLEQEVKERTRKHETVNRNLRTEIYIREKTERELIRINERMKDIVRSSRELDSAENLLEASEMILKEFAKNMNAKGGSIFLKHNKSFILQSSLDNMNVPPSISTELKENSLFNRSLKTKQPVLIKDITKENNIYNSGWDGYKDGSVLIFPLMDRDDDIMGLISLHNKKSPPFSPQDLDVGTVFASYCGEKIQALKAVDALRRNEKKYRFIAENTNDVIWTVDLDLEYSYVSPSIHKVSGFTQEALIGSNISETLTKESYSIILKILSKTIANKESVDENPILELEKKRKDGSLFWVEEHITILRDKGDVVGILGVSRDITKKKELELKLRQAQKMESIGTLAGGIAHDFNNILAGILGNTELLKIKLPEDDFFNKKLNNILSATIRAKDLVSQILEFSRQVETRRANVDSRIILKEITKMLRSLLPSTVKIFCKVTNEPLYIHADINQIHQVIMNLCTNAHHAMKDRGGVLTLKVTDHTDNNTDENWVLLTISDTGHGISSEIVTRIFDPYFTTKDKGVGTGLGLAVVHGIVQSHGGKITLESNENGTEFKILFPKVGRATQIETIETIETIKSGSETILFVDDEPSIIEVCEDMLGHLGYKVITTTSSVEALGIFEERKNEIDLVITDMTMPEMTGDILAAKIKEIAPDKPVIMCTGFSEGFTYESSKKSGIINELLIKPVKIVDLVKSINTVFNRKNFL
ncbi:MAG: response regulator [Desulfobacterales bacterium]|nr:response regulator [Desulfobacterales bacterium]MCP4162142.1 response regulator [Deltaproteobacteria bacterium]